jgi:hypothetical protein
MKFRYSALLILPLSVLAGLMFLYANTDDLTKSEWSILPDDDKIQFIDIAIMELKDNHIPVSKSPNDYLQDINDFYDKSSDSKQISITDILPAIVYEKEPASRKAIDELRKKSGTNK